MGAHTHVHTTLHTFQTQSKPHTDTYPHTQHTHLALGRAVEARDITRIDGRVFDKDLREVDQTRPRRILEDLYNTWIQTEQSVVEIAALATHSW